MLLINDTRMYQMWNMRLSGLTHASHWLDSVSDLIVRLICDGDNDSRVEHEPALAAGDIAFTLLACH